MICNYMVFQKWVVRFSATKVIILVAEQMDAINTNISPNWRTICIKRSHQFFRTPKDWSFNHIQDESFEEELFFDDTGIELYEETQRNLYTSDIE